MPTCARAIPGGCAPRRRHWPPGGNRYPDVGHSCRRRDLPRRLRPSALGLVDLPAASRHPYAVGMLARVLALAIAVAVGGTAVLPWRDGARCLVMNKRVALGEGCCPSASRRRSPPSEPRAVRSSPAARSKRARPTPSPTCASRRRRSSASAAARRASRNGPRSAPSRAGPGRPPGDELARFSAVLRVSASVASTIRSIRLRRCPWIPSFTQVRARAPRALALLVSSLAHASGHGPVYGLATPTLGKGSWSLDVAAMGMSGDGHRLMVRPMVGYGSRPTCNCPRRCPSRCSRSASWRDRA